MRLNDYQKRAAATDHNRRKDWQGRMAPIFGLASETGAVLEAYKRLLRDNIEEMISTGLSLMPEGLEKEITVEQMADLLAFVKAIAPAAATASK